MTIVGEISLIFTSIVSAGALAVIAVTLGEIRDRLG